MSNPLNFYTGIFLHVILVHLHFRGSFNLIMSEYKNKRNNLICLQIQNQIC